MNNVHATAIISRDADLGRNITIGPWSIVEAGVVIGDDCQIGPHVVIRGGTILGKRNTIYQFASIGEACQDKKYLGESTRLMIGDDNIIREACTLHRGTRHDGGDGNTVIGNHNMLMVNVHIAHDCRVGNHNTLSNNCALAGHVQLDDHIVMGGFTGVHQFCRIGSLSFTGVSSVILQDVPPFIRATGSPARPKGINVIGLRRYHYDSMTRQMIKRAYRLLLRSDTPQVDALRQVLTLSADYPPLRMLVNFFNAPSLRSIMRDKPHLSLTPGKP